MLENSGTSIVVKDIPVAIKLPKRYHVPCVMLLDKSGSMEGKPIDALNQALSDFKDMFSKHSKDHSAIDLCIIAFYDIGDGNDIQILQDFVAANEMTYTEPLVANGRTPIAKAVENGLDEIARIKKTYQSNGTPYYRPWLVCLTDGESVGEKQEYYDSIKQRLKEEVDGKHVTPYGIGVGDDCNYAKLLDFFGEGHTFRLDEIDGIGKFKELFQFLSKSMSTKSEKNGEKGPMPSAGDLLGTVTFSKKVPINLSSD